MIFTNGRVVLPGAVRDDLIVLVVNGKIAAVSDAEVQHDGQTIDLAGNFLAPGFIDLHVHGARGADTMDGTAEAFRKICDFHASGGTTSLLLTTATAPLAEITRVLEAIRASRAELRQMAGAHIEGPFISAERPGAQRKDFIREADAESTARMLEFTDVIKRVTLAPEIPGALDLIDRFREHDIAVSGGHSDAWDEQARSGFEHGMRHVTHTFNCMSSARRRGAERVAGLLEFALSEPEITCELIADGHHVSPTLMKMMYHAKGADGICLVTDATAGAGLAEGTRFTLAGLECVVAGGVCLLADRSALAGSAARMIDLVRTMVHQVGVPLHEAVAMATTNSARALGSTTKGQIAAGADADLCVLSGELEVIRTFCGGREIFRRG
jgi:N-acetylglucosamine-6-phosphate deacetylase